MIQLTAVQSPHPPPSPSQPLVRLGKPAGMDRGLLIAHKETWDQFIRQRESNPHRMMFNETDDVLVVFEGNSSFLLIILLRPLPLTISTNLTTIVDHYHTLIHISSLSFHPLITLIAY